MCICIYIYAKLYMLNFTIVLYILHIQYYIYTIALRSGRGFIPHIQQRQKDEARISKRTDSSDGNVWYSITNYIVYDSLLYHVVYCITLFMSEFFITKML